MPPPLQPAVRPPTIASRKKPTRRTSRSILEGDLGGMPTNTRIGVRYEKTDVTSTSQVALPSAIAVAGNNDFQPALDRRSSPSARRTATITCCRTWTSASTSPRAEGPRIVQQDHRARAVRQPVSPVRPRAQPTGSILINPSTRATGDAAEPGAGYRWNRTTWTWRWSGTSPTPASCR